MEYVATNELQNVIPWPLTTILSPLATRRSPLPPDSLATILPPLPTHQAGILQKYPNIKWTKDRGNEPERTKEEYPWFWDGGTFKGERVNDRHDTITEKQAARERLKHKASTRR
jgi:hypothetical protein